MRCLRHARNTAMVAAFVVATVLVPATTASANATVASGAIAFSGDATLSKFPCEPPPPYGTGPCSGQFSGEWSGHVSGNNGLHSFDVSWTTVGLADGGGVAASVTYNELVCADLETLAGYAEGTATAVANPGAITGTYQIPGELFPRAITKVTFSGSFVWLRMLNDAVLVFDATSVRIDVANLGTVTVVSGEQVGNATFALAPGGIGVPTCTKPWNNAHATVAGSIPLAGLPSPETR